MKHLVQQKPKKRMSRILCLVLTVGVLLSCVGVVLAKYIQKKQADDLYVAEAFYFTSDYLQPAQSNGQYVLYTLQEGVDEIGFQLRNYADDLRKSEVEYTCQVYLDSIAQGNPQKLTEGNPTTDVVLPGLETGKIYMVEAKVTEPYAQTIGARFRLVAAKNNIECEAYGSSDSPALQLTVRTNQYSGKIKITWGEGIFPDQTDPMLEGAPYGDNQTYEIELGHNSEYTFRFFKSDLNVKTDLKAESVK